MLSEGTKFTDKVGTEAEDVSDKVAVLKLFNQVPNIYQDEIIVKIPYCFYGTASLPGGASPTAYQRWRINSIWDPDFDNGAGNFQPLGRDTYAEIYNYYKVLKATAKVTYYDTRNITSNTDNSSRYASLHGGSINLTALPPSSENIWMMNQYIGSTNKQAVYSNVSMYNPMTGRDSAFKSYYMEWDPTLLQSAILNQSVEDSWTPVGSNPDSVEYFNQLCYNPQTIAEGAIRIVYFTEIIFMVSFKQVKASLYDTLN